jgi:hypothetical protein
VLGALLVVIAALAALPAIALTIAVGIYFFVWLDFRAHPEKVWPEWFEEIRGDLVPVWFLTLLVAVGGVVLGLRFVRGNRHLLLFLRRFGFSPATQTVSEATTQLGDFWRVVTLDDDRIQSLGSGEGVEGLVDVVTDVKRSYQKARPVVTKGWKLVMRGAATLLAISLVVVVRPGPDWDARLDRLEVLADIGREPDGGWMLAARIAVAVLIAGMAMAVLWAVVVVVIGWVLSLPIRLVYGGVARGVTEAAALDELPIVEVGQIALVGEMVRRQSRRVFGARLAVLTVSSAIWQETVTGIAELCAIPLIDISEPTENVLWEVEELVRRFGDRCVFIGSYDRLQELTTRKPDPQMERLSTFLEGRQVLGYQSDAGSRERFVRALGSTLERHIRRPLPIDTST